MCGGLQLCNCLCVCVCVCVFLMNALILTTACALRSVSAYTQLYVDPSVKKKQAASGDHKASVTTAEEKEMAAKALSPNVPKCNLGVPLIIVGTKVGSGTASVAVLCRV